MLMFRNTGWRTKCHTIDCARKKFLITKAFDIWDELILIGWKIVPNEEHVQCDHRFASQPLANEPLNSSQLFDTSLQRARHNFTMWALSCLFLMKNMFNVTTVLPHNLLQTNP